jgi:hypothetical protein
MIGFGIDAIILASESATGSGGAGIVCAATGLLITGNKTSLYIHDEKKAQITNRTAPVIRILIF